MTDRPKSIAEALAEVQRKVNEQRAERLNNMIEAIGPAVAYRKGEGATGVALAGQGIGLENRRNQDFVKQTLGDKYDPKIHKAGSAASNLALLAHAKSQQQATPAPTGSQSAAGNGDVQKGVTAAPVAPYSSGEEGKAKADAIAGTDRAIENNARKGTSSQLSGKPLEADGSNATPAQYGIANRNAGAAGGTTIGSARQFGTIAAAGNAGGAGDDRARAEMSTDQKAKIDSDAAARQADMNAEREKNIAAQAAKRAAPSSDSPSVFSRVKDFFTKPTETKVDDNGIKKPEESESGPKGKKKMSESALIGAFLKLQETNHPNIFEAAKKAKKDYDGDGKIESGKDEYLGSRIAAAKKAEKMKAYRADRDKHGEMEEEVEQINEIGDTPAGKAALNSYAKKAQKNIGKLDKSMEKNYNQNADIRPDDDDETPVGQSKSYMNDYRKVGNRDKGLDRAIARGAKLKEERTPHSDPNMEKIAKNYEKPAKEIMGSEWHSAIKKAGYKSPYKSATHYGVYAKHSSKPQLEYGLHTGHVHVGNKKYSSPSDFLKDHGDVNEETFPGFSESEIAHFEAVIARKDQKGKDRGPGDVVASEDLTDEYINEGVKKGSKRGSYKGKAHKGGADAKGASMPDEEPKGVPHVLDQIRHGHEDEQGFKTITHPASSTEAPVTKRIHRSELHGFYDQYHNTEKPAAKEKAYSAFLGKHFGDERATAPTSKSVTTDLSKVEKANLKGGAGKVSLGGSKLVGGKK